ncbi:MAG TPA: polysaccharide biosynthesis/export family protein [Candidatus Synoicihabitans sp.]|nr:polysaccharide biosynthesis/export family protein [Candidatus Synoicihabitans sp.]
MTHSPWYLLALGLAAGGMAVAQPIATPESVTTSRSAATDPAYVLAVGDTVAVTIDQEPDLARTKLIDANGSADLALVGLVNLAGQSVREAEASIADVYREQEYLVKPKVTVAVLDYAPRFVTLLGAVKAPGKLNFPKDKKQWEILDVLTQGGGLLPTARGSAATLTRGPSSGQAGVVINVDLDAILAGRRMSAAKRAEFVVYPGDTIVVPERLF